MQRQSPRRRPRVVVIDDDPSTVEVLDAILNSEGYEVEGCTQWERAVALVEREQPEVVLLDLLFAGRERGWDLLSALKANEDTQPIPVVLCSSANGSLSRNEAAIRAYAAHVVHKPFDLYDLVTTVRAVTGQPAVRR